MGATMIDFAFGFATCATVMTLFPTIATKINAGVRRVIAWGKAQYDAWQTKKASKP